MAIPLKKNLETVLRQRRETGTIVTLWIDAIRINQQDDEEKSWHVPSMNIIYLTAQTVTIWLGSADADSDLAMLGLLHLGHKGVYEGMPNLGRRGLDAFEHFLNRPWWDRVRIIQEVALGGLGGNIGKLKVQCGTEKIG
ncbi:hypothetical protein AAE478_008668 [Parahypoxylon ruwenzoriense]